MQIWGNVEKRLFFWRVERTYQQPEGGLMTKGISDLIYLYAAICFLIKSYLALF